MAADERPHPDIMRRFARESAPVRWFCFDGIYVHDAQGYRLQ